jgi:hypothetical protein
MKEGSINPFGLRVALFGLCTLVVSASALTEGRTFHVLLIASLGLLVMLRLLCHGRRWYIARYALGCLGFAVLALAAWKDQREGIAAALAMGSVVLGLAGLVRLRSDRDGTRPDAEAGSSGSP